MGLDFSKAFDSVSHKHIFNVLKAMKFPQKFLGYIRKLHMDPLIILEVNEIRSDLFGMVDSSGQGDPISAFLFNIAVEPFLIMLANSDKIPRFRLEDDIDDDAGLITAP